MTTEAKLTVGDLHAAYTVLSAVMGENQKMSSKAAYWLARMLKRLEPEALPAENTRVALVKEFGEKKDGQTAVTTRLSEFLDKWKEIVNVESDLVPIKVKIDILDGVEMTPQQMLTLEKFVEE